MVLPIITKSLLKSSLRKATQPPRRHLKKMAERNEQSTTLGRFCCYSVYDLIVRYVQRSLKGACGLGHGFPNKPF